MEFRFSEAEIFLGEYESIWGALDGCGTDSTEITITPIRLAIFDLQDLKPGFRLNNVGCTELFRRLADSAQGRQTPLVYSVFRDYFHRRDKNGTCEHIHKSCSLAVRNPMGIGVDLLVTYEHYDDKD